MVLAEVGASNAPASSKLARFVKEPLLHFMVACAAIYLLFGWFGQSKSDDATLEENAIVVTEGEMNWLADMWHKKMTEMRVENGALEVLESRLANVRRGTSPPVETDVGQRRAARQISGRNASLEAASDKMSDADSAHSETAPVSSFDAP
jgi:hypothetical protein